MVDDNLENNKEADHRGKKTRTDSSYGFYLGGIDAEALQLISDKNNAASFQRFIGCLSEISFEGIKVDFAVAKPTGPNADFSSCPVQDPVEFTTPEMGQLGKVGL